MTGRRTAAVMGAAVMVTACGGAPSATPSGAESPSGEAPAVERTLTAKDIAFRPGELSIPVGNALIVAFDNIDPGVPHGLVLYADPAQTITLASAPIVTGPNHQAFRIAPLIAGRYRFSCVVHPNMAADLIVEP